MSGNTYGNKFPATTFPDEVQELIKYTDLTQADLGNYNLYKNAIESGNFTAARTYLSNIEAGGVHKCISSGELNKLIDTVNAIQYYMTDEGWQQMVSTTQAAWMTIINQFSLIGTWASSTSYKKWNMVTYASPTAGTDGTTYLYISLVDNNQNIQPFTDAENQGGHWYRLTIRGAQGTSGTTGTFKGDWNASASYILNDIVVESGVWYAATAGNTNARPSEHPEYWTIFIEPKLRQYPVSSTQPTNQETGDLWFEVI